MKRTAEFRSKVLIKHVNIHKLIWHESHSFQVFTAINELKKQLLLNVNATINMMKGKVLNIKTKI